MRAFDQCDFEGLFQIALEQFDDRPEVKKSLLAFYESANKLLAALIREDASRKRGTVYD